MAAASQQPLVLSASAEAAIRECFPVSSADPLDDPNFDPVAFINRNFPDENSIGRMETFVARLGAKIKRLDVETRDAIRTQATQGTRAAQDIEGAKAAMRGLCAKITDIKRKAEESETMVTEICRDIKKLDLAKRHLTTTITALKRLHMLVTAVDQLQYMARKRQYREAANLLEAVIQLSSHFAKYRAVPKIAELRLSVDRTRDDLTKQVFEEFAEMGRTVSAVMSGEDGGGAYGMGGAAAGGGAGGGGACSSRSCSHSVAP